MHILIIHQAFAGPNDPGGTRHFEFARHLVAQGHQVTIVAANVNYQTGKPVVAGAGLAAEERLEGVRVLRSYVYPSLHRSFVWRVVAFLSFMLSSVVVALRVGPVDVVLGTSPPIFQAISAWLVALIRRRPFLLEIRDLWPVFAIDMGVLKNPQLIRLARWLEAFLYARADHILVNSPAYRDYLLDRGVPALRVTLIPNGVDPSMFDPEADGAAFRARFGLDDHFVVTYAGALGAANDLPTVLRAAALLGGKPAIRFVLVGDGKERQTLEELARELRLDNLLFTGPLPKSEMGQVLAGSDACVATLLDIPMFRTTYPNKVFDYMAAGRPTLLAIDGVIRRVIDDAGGGIFVQPGSPEELAAAVARLADDPAAARAMGAAARRYVVEQFNRSSHARQFAVLVATLDRRGLGAVVAPPQ